MINILLHIFAVVGVFFSCIATVDLIMLVILTIQYRIQERHRKKEEEKKAKEVYDRIVSALEEYEGGRSKKYD